MSKERKTEYPGLGKWGYKENFIDFKKIKEEVNALIAGMTEEEIRAYAKKLDEEIAEDTRLARLKQEKKKQRCHKHKRNNC
jgi:hypothetical protein